jgi:hypothetical protein
MEDEKHCDTPTDVAVDVGEAIVAVSHEEEDSVPEDVYRDEKETLPEYRLFPIRDADIALNLFRARMCVSVKKLREMIEKRKGRTTKDGTKWTYVQFACYPNEVAIVPVATSIDANGTVTYEQRKIFLKDHFKRCANAIHRHFMQIREDYGYKFSLVKNGRLSVRVYFDEK